MRPEPRDDATIIPSDGVGLAAWTRGHGPLLLLVHGTATDHRCFNPVIDHFSGYQVVTYDRRGHGLTGGDSTSDISAEVRDLTNVWAHFRVSHKPAFILAYSYGGLLALHALSSRAVDADAAVLYEPPMQDPEMLPAAAQVRQLIAEGALDDALTAFVQTTFHLPPRAVEAMRRGPMWAVALAHASTIPAELDAVEATPVPTPDGPTPPIGVLVAAKDGNPSFQRIAEQITGRLPSAQIIRVTGLPHFAMATNSTKFAAAVDDFLANTKPRD